MSIMDEEELEDDEDEAVVGDNEVDLLFFSRLNCLPSSRTRSDIILFSSSIVSSSSEEEEGMANGCESFLRCLELDLLFLLL